MPAAAAMWSLRGVSRTPPACSAGKGPAPTPKAPEATLHLAACLGYVERVAWLLQDGADANTRDEEGRTPLQLAARNGRMDVVSVLVACGADLHAADVAGQTLMHYAAACEAGDPSAAKALIELGADVNARDKQGRTPLHVARFVDPASPITELLEATVADPNARDTLGLTPSSYQAMQPSAPLEGEGSCQAGPGLPTAYATPPLLVPGADVIAYMHQHRDNLRRHLQVHAMGQ